MKQSDNTFIDAEHCICCGRVIPEGRQVCTMCESLTSVQTFAEIGYLDSVSYSELTGILSSIETNRKEDDDIGTSKKEY